MNAGWCDIGDLVYLLAAPADLVQPYHSKREPLWHVATLIWLQVNIIRLALRSGSAHYIYELVPDTIDIVPNSSRTYLQ